ncbi:hypothetical protein BDR05DRAFT_836432, partial [Suillus weaverae]
VKVLFDKGAMISAMCMIVFDSVKHHLGNWRVSVKKLRMANGVLVPSKGTWKGKVIIAGVNIQREFEVLENSREWKFLLGKLMLQAFKTIHEYETDTVHITGNG